MKKLIILILICLWAFVETKAQSNYFITSVTGVKVRMQGSGILTNQNLIDTSELATSKRLWFLSPKGYDPGTGNWFQAGMLNVTLENLSSSQWKKVSLYDFTGVNLLYTQNLSPNAIFYWDFDNGKRLDASKDYYWKIEDITSQAISCKNDVKNIPASSFDNIDVLNNDLNLPALADCRLKAGQTLSGGITVIKDQYTGLRVTTSSQKGSFSFVYEAISSNGTVLGEATATVIVGDAAQYCTLSILAEQLQDGSQTIHEFTMYSPNAQINPFNYEVRIGSFSGSIVKSGTTPVATSNKEVIDFGTLATGTYYVKFSSAVSQCFDIRAVSHIANTDACNASIISIDKINGTNNYSVNSSFSNVATIKYYLTNAQTSVATPLLTQTNVSTPSFNLDLSTLTNGTYFLNIEGEGKFCKAQKSFDHTAINLINGAKLETWTKFIHNYKDNWIIAGKNDYESGRDKFGLQTFNEKADNVVWKSFISDFENLGNSPKAKAIIGFRKDTSRNEIGVSVGVTANSIILQQRSERSGATNILATINNVTMPVWVRLTKTGNDLIADYSKDLTMSPTYTQIGRIIGAFTGFTKYQKFIGVASAKTDVIATARFQGQLGGNVNFASPTITVLPPVIATNVSSPSSGQSITLSTSTACVAPATNMWYKNTQIASFSAGSTVNVQGFNGDSYYARCEIGLNKSIASNVVSFTISNLVSCNNGTQPFSVSTAVYNNGSITFSFNASNLSNTNYSIINGSTVVANSTVQPTSSSTTISVTSLAAGNYIFKLNGISCNGTAQKAFTVDGAGSSPILTSVPISPVTGNNVTLTATGCVGNYNFYRNVEVNPITISGGTATITNVQSLDYYYVQCSTGSLNSNYIQVGSIATNGSGGGAMLFNNVLKSVPFETTLGKYNPDAFPTISVSSSSDPVLSNKLFPNWSVSWKVEGRNFSNSTRNKKTPNVGIPFMFDLLATPYGGYGQRCVDYIYPQNPSNGLVWASDDACGGVQFNQYFGNLEHTNANFSSALPFEERAGDGGGAGLDRITEWNGISDLGYFYDQGHVGSERFGFRDWVNGKANIGLADYDNEGTFDTNKSLAILLGLASKSSGYVFDQYANILGAVYIDPSQYPLDFNNPNSLYPQYSQLINETNGEPNSGGAALVANTIPNRQFWDPTYKIAIASKFSGTKGIIDEPTILPSTEVSCLSSATFRQGESYVYNTTGGTRVVNKFGLNANTQHMIARTIFAAETHKWYCVNKLNNRKMIIQAKILCDQQQNGLLLDQSYGNSFITNTSLANKHFDREYGFDIGAFVALTGCEWNVWDRNNADQVLDGYHGAFGIINLLSQRKNFGSESKSFVDLKPTAKFLLWTSQISYDNGLTYLTEKANKYAMNQSSIPQRQFITPDGYWGGFLARPENTESTSCVLRVMYNGQNYTHTVTPDMWETVDYSYRNTDLASLPNDKKDYYYFLIKLTNGATTESTPTNPINVFVFVGESNAGTRNANSTLLAGEGGPRTGVRIWNNANNQLEQLNVGTNNYQGENAAVANGWGWEVELANLRSNGTIANDFVIVKTAQGGALIGQYNTDIPGGYYSILQSRINGVKNALQAEGKTPTFYVMYSQGINNALYPNIDDQSHFPNVTGINYWQSATTTMLSNLRSLMGANTNISLMKFPGTFGTYLNGAITNLVNNNALNSFINTSDLGIQSDGLHFDAPATRIITDRYINVIGLPLSPVVQTTTPTTTGVTVTEPAKAPYFFSNNQSPSFYTNRANKPSVFTNASTFDAVNDVVYLQNSDVKYGINLKRGGQLCYASLTGTDNSLVFNGYDGGFQVQLDATQILSPATVQGQTSGSPQNNNAYNTTIGGDYLNQATTLIDYHTVGTNGYYVKFRPLLYPFNGLVSEVEIEATYTLIGRALKIEYKYTSFRTDGNFPLNPTAPGGYKGWAVPICFLVEKLNRYQTYTGTSPWNINSPVEDGDIPNTTPNQGGGVLLGKNTKEFWGLSYNSSENLGLGSLNMSEGGTDGYMTWEQREKYAGNPVGGVFGNGGRTTMDILSNVLVPDGGNFIKSTTAFIAIGTPLQIRQSFYTNTGHSL